MNLKEAFRFQNRLQDLFRTAEDIVSDDRNVLKVERTTLRKKIMPEVENEVVMETPDSEYADQITRMCEFLLYLLEEQEKLADAIHAAKAKLDVHIDSETGLNRTRQLLAAIFAHMGDLRSSEITIAGGGTGYRFNADGNQVAYKCDLKKVTTIHFDRLRIRKYANQLHKKADEVSAALDQALINTDVGYEAPFDVNDSFASVFEEFVSSHPDR